MLLEIQEASDDITNAYEEDESDENIDDDGHSSSSEEESERKRVTWNLRLIVIFYEEKHSFRLN